MANSAEENSDLFYDDFEDLESAIDSNSNEIDGEILELCGNVSIYTVFKYSKSFSLLEIYTLNIIYIITTLKKT